MSTTRRDFLKSTAAAAVVAGSPGLFGRNDPLNRIVAASGTDAFVEELAMEGLNAARAAGASYADVRVGRYRRQSVNTRERQVTGVSDSESFGIGIRTIVNGSWGSFDDCKNSKRHGFGLVVIRRTRLESSPARATWRTGR